MKLTLEKNEIMAIRKVITHELQQSFVDHKKYEILRILNK
jgi:hypothetical protein